MGCRMGICYQCVCPCADGAVRDLRTGEITYAAPGDGVAIQTCISAPPGRARSSIEEPPLTDCLVA
jgi:hypothetical protein